MLYLTNNKNKQNLDEPTLIKINEKILNAKQLLNDANQGLIFKEKEHKYYLEDKEMNSVSSIVSYFSPFNTEKKAFEVSKNPNSPYYKQNIEDILKIWSKKRDLALKHESQIHEFAENCCLYYIDKINKINLNYKTRLTKKGFLATSPKEEAVVKYWQDLNPNKDIVIEKETKIVNPKYNFAGTFDLLLYNIENDTFHLRDYKTNEDLEKWFGDYLKAPLHFLKSNDINKYTLQQNLYAYQLNNIGIKIASINLIWIKENSNYELISLPLLPNKTIEMALTKYNHI